MSAVAQRSVAGFGKRKTHRKVRTGCITCKIRRVKCDEEKPECKRCRNTGRKCDGYASFTSCEPGNAGRSWSEDPTTDHSSLPLVRFSPPSSDKPTSPAEKRAIEYFHCNTLKALSGLVDSVVWSRLLLQLGEAEPLLKHAMVSFSSFHELSLSHGVDQLFTDSVTEDHFALQQYNKAINTLRNRLAQGKTSKTVTLLSCLIFICLEFLRGNRTAAITHLRNGMQILRLEPPDKSSDGQVASTWEKPDEDIASVFARLTLVQSIYGQPRPARYIDLMPLPVSDVKGAFASLDEARTHMVNMTNAAMTFTYMADYELFSDHDTKMATQADIIAKIHAWLDSFKPLLEKASDERTRRAALTLKATALLDLLYTRKMSSVLETTFDDYMDDFQTIIDTIEPILEVPDNEKEQDPMFNKNFSVDTGLISNLFFTGAKCRDRLKRRRAIELLYKCPRREGLWDAVECAKVVEAIVAVEEAGLGDLPDCLDLPEEKARVHDLDIRPRNPADPGRQLVIMTNRRDGISSQVVSEMCRIWLTWE